MQSGHPGVSVSIRFRVCDKNYLVTLGRDVGRYICYRLSTKLGEGNVFSRVCLLT